MNNSIQYVLSSPTSQNGNTFQTFEDQNSQSQYQYSQQPSSNHLFTSMNQQQPINKGGSMQPMMQAQSKISNYRYDFEINPNFQNHNEIQNATAIKMQMFDHMPQQNVLQQSYKIGQTPYTGQQQLTAYAKRSGFNSKFESPADTARNIGIDLNQTMFEESKQGKEEGALKVQHRDIKFSNKLPNAFRVYRGKHSTRQDSSQLMMKPSTCESSFTQRNV